MRGDWDATAGANRAFVLRGQLSAPAVPVACEELLGAMTGFWDS
ncbi:hypothetical protein [Streptomyces sp. NPDC003660]